MYGYIYMTINKINGKYYIGKHKSNAYDPNYLGSGIHLRSAIEKYGKENFYNFILCQADSLEELNEKEKLCIKELDAQSIGYNIAPGGDGGEVWGDASNHPSLGKHGLQGELNPMYGKHLSDEAIEKIKQKLTGRKKIYKDGKWKLIYPEEIDSYIQDGWKCPSLEHEEKQKNYIPKERKKGWHHSEESKRKISESEHKTKDNPEFKQWFSERVKEGISNMSEEKREEFRENCRKAQTGKTMSEETKRKTSETLKEGYKAGKYKNQKGRTAWNKGLPVSEEMREKLSSISKGRIHITNGEINKMIYPEQLEEWELKGFHKGRTIIKHKEEK